MDKLGSGFVVRLQDKLVFEELEKLAALRASRGIVLIAFASVLCGVRSNELMEELAELQESWLRKWLKLPNSIPCANILRDHGAAPHPA